MKVSPFLYGIGLLLPSLFIIQRPFQAEPARETRVLPVPGPPDCASATGLARVVCLAEAFKATLTSSQLAQLQLPYTKADAVRWSNFPQPFSRPKRVGVGFGSFSAPQLAAANTLLGAVLAQGVPNEGYDEAEGGRAADDYLGTTLGKTDVFGAGNFYMAFLGTPSTTGLWELQYGGHHYAFANTYNGGNVTGVTPSFRGVEPMTSFTRNGKTYQPAEQERQAFATLLESLSKREQTTAQLPATFTDVLLGPGADSRFPSTRQGIRVSELSGPQQKLVRNAIKLYVNDLDGETAAAVLVRYTAELPDTYIGYSGSGTMSQPGDYIRIDGPGVWIEYSGQPSRDIPGTVHPHSVWRDRLTDYGGN